MYFKNIAGIFADFCAHSYNMIIPINFEVYHNIKELGLVNLFNWTSTSEQLQIVLWY